MKGNLSSKPFSINATVTGEFQLYWIWDPILTAQVLQILNHKRGAPSVALEGCDIFYNRGLQSSRGLWYVLLSHRKMREIAEKESEMGELQRKQSGEQNEGVAERTRGRDSGVQESRDKRKKLGRKESEKEPGNE